MKVVVVGKGGREHALAKQIAQSPHLTELWVCPGNPGMRRSGFNCVSQESPEAIEQFCIENKIDLVVIGPEALILSNLKTNLEKKGIPCFAPSPEAAQLESSKVFCKKVLQEAGVLTAALNICHQLPEALTAVRQHDFASPLVVKADGLAQGKGVWICESEQKALEAVETLSGQFGWPLLLEECLVGQELSAFALCDGQDFVLLGTACDYKRITPDPFSANTGGMGAFSPCDFINDKDEEDLKEIFTKTLHYLRSTGTPFEGFLFAGLMKTAKGLYVLEYNVRMGDPETQALLPRLQSDFLTLLMAAVKKELKGVSCELKSLYTVHVVAVSQGYPQAQMLLQKKIQYPSSDKLKAELYFAGVSEMKEDLINSGGRVLGVTAQAPTKLEAIHLAYQDIKKISFEGMYFREDIGT